MRPRHAWLLARAPMFVVVGACAWLARAYGGGADARSRPPQPYAGATEAADPQSARGKKARGADAYEVKARLVEKIADARYEVPNARAALAAFSTHWRKMSVPWLAVPGDAAARITSIALRTSLSETQWAMPKSNGGVWAPDARVWNMNEGSFDQRESIFAPAPATVAFRLAIPPHARLTLSPGVVNGAGTTTVFSVVVVDAAGVAHDAYAHRVGPAHAHAWVDAAVDLAPYAGQTVELQLKTASDAPNDDERRAMKRAPARAAALAQPVRSTPAAPLDAARARAPNAAAATPLAVWGHPTLLARGPTSAPYNVLWIVVDALRPDVIASFHDDAEDAAKRAAHRPPLEALLPKVPGLVPAIDDLARHGVRFTHAYSAGSWTRPGTLAMLAGARSTELGVETLPWMLADAALQRFYGSSPPLLPLLLRRAGVTTRAFVNNYFMVGYAPVGVDMGFERVDDHRYRTRDTLEITQSAVDWLGAHGDERFFVFCNFNSPHEPWEAPERFQARVPPPPAGPSDHIARMYMAEAAKDDEAIGILLATLDKVGARANTLVVVTADHGETLSSAHAGVSKLDNMKVRYHHAVSNYEETSRIPILLSLPGVVDGGTAVTARVRNVDLAPTVLELQGMAVPPRMSGRSLVALARGGKEADARVVVTEGRGTRAILSGKYRLLVREGGARTTTFDDRVVTVGEELYDLEDDPGERHDLARERPDVVAEMRARLDAALKNVPAADAVGAGAAAGTVAQSTASTLRLRFAGAGKSRRVSGKVTVGDGGRSPEAAPLVKVHAVGVAPDAFRLDGRTVEIALSTVGDAVVGLDLDIDPPNAPVAYSLFLDDAPWPAGHVFGGPFGISAPELAVGVATDDARAAAYAASPPRIDPARDLGVFVTRDRAADVREARAPERVVTSGGTREMHRLLQEWGYAHGSAATKK